MEYLVMSEYQNLDSGNPCYVLSLSLLSSFDWLSAYPTFGPGATSVMRTGERNLMIDVESFSLSLSLSLFFSAELGAGERKVCFFLFSFSLISSISHFTRPS